MWLWWVRIPSRDLTDVTLVSEDTDDHDDSDGNDDKKDSFKVSPEPTSESVCGIFPPPHYHQGIVADNGSQK